MRFGGLQMASGGVGGHQAVAEGDISSGLIEQEIRRYKRNGENLIPVQAFLSAQALGTAHSHAESRINI